MLRYGLLACLLLRAASEGVRLTFTHDYSVSTTIQCRTDIQCSSLRSPAPTTTVTTRLLPEVVLLLVESTSTYTVTPAAATTTSISTISETVHVTAVAITDTFSTTSTITNIDTTTDLVTVTSASTVLSTATTYTTVTAEASAGFVPAGGPNGSAGARKKQKKADVVHPHGGGRPAPRGNGGSGRPFCTHPGAVTCVAYAQPQYTEEVVVLLPSATTTIPPSTSTSVVFTTATSTSTIAPPDVSVTLSFTDTVSVTTGSTSTVTDITVVQSTVTATSTATYYAACGPDNVLGPQLPDGNYIDPNRLLYVDLPQGYSVNVHSAYDCCVACIQDELCPFAIYRGGSYCEISENVFACSDNNQLLFRETTTPQSDIAVSNGYCGTVRDYGSF